MSHNVTPASTFTTTITVPDDGDSGLGASVESPVQALANRTEYLNDNKATGLATSVDNEVPRLDSTGGKTLQGSDLTISDSGDLVYKAAKPRTIIIPATSASFGVSGTDAGTTYQHGTSPSVTMISDTMSAVFSLNELVPDGAELTSVSAKLKPGAVRAGVNKMRVVAVYSSHDYGFDTVPSEFALSGWSTGSDDGTTDTQVITTSGTLHTVSKNPTVDAYRVYMVRVSSGNTASADNDLLHSIIVTYNDPGPRNH
jgi:hypothetical protein